MKQYIGTKLISAVPAVRKGGKIYEPGEAIPRSMVPVEEGYKVFYPDGYVSWSPKDVFESAYLELLRDETLNKETPHITQKMVDDFISEVAYFNGCGITCLKATLRNGTNLAECAPYGVGDNIDVEQAACLDKVKERVHCLLEFLLQTAVHGIDKMEDKS